MLLRKSSLIVAATVAASLSAGSAAAAEAAELPVPYGPGPAPYDDDTVIVKYRSEVTPPKARALAGVRRILGGVAGVDAEVARVHGDPAEVANRLERSRRVAYAEPNFILSAEATPNDSRFGEQWALHNTGQTGGKRDADIDARKGWSRAGLGGFPAAGGTRVGIVDTGIDASHPDLRGKMIGCVDKLRTLLRPRCDDDDGHGTHVAGIVGAAANNGRGVAGVAFDSRLLICRALGRTPFVSGAATGSTSDVASCIGWAHASGAKVISMSFDAGPSRTLEDAARRAWSGGGRDGSVLVAAAGNQGDSRTRYPAGYSRVVSVGATDAHDRRAALSNMNRDVELSAPGVGILSTFPGGGYHQLSGTSMATPHVAGVAAALWRLHPRSRAERIRRRLHDGVDDLGRNGRDKKYGYGRVSLAKAVR